MPCECDNPRNERRSQAVERKQKWAAWERDSITDTGGQIPAVVVLGQSAPGRGSGEAFGCQWEIKTAPFFVV